MVVGIGTVEIAIRDSRSLKDKRSVVRRIIGRTEAAFSLAIAEVDCMDNQKRATIGFAVVGNDRQYINSKVDKVVHFIERLSLAEVVDSAIEIMTVSELYGTPGEPPEGDDDDV